MFGNRTQTIILGMKFDVSMVCVCGVVGGWVVGVCAVVISSVVLVVLFCSSSRLD